MVISIKRGPRGSDKLGGAGNKGIVFFIIIISLLTLFNFLYF